MYTEPAELAYPRLRTALSPFRFCLPARVLLTLMVELSSRFHLTTGSGEPDAAHARDTLAFSRTITSEELCVSEMLGGTANREGREGR